MPHIHEKIDFTVSVFVVYKRRVLLRKHEKYHIWLGVGGHVELDENPNLTAIREVKEEVGLDIKLVQTKDLPVYSKKDHIELIPPEFMNIHQINETHQHCDMTFFATTESDAVVPEDPNDKWEWLSMTDLEEKKAELREDIYFYAKKALLTVE